MIPFVSLAGVNALIFLNAFDSHPFRTLVRDVVDTVWGAFCLRRLKASATPQPSAMVSPRPPPAPNPSRNKHLRQISSRSLGRDAGALFGDGRPFVAGDHVLQNGSFLVRDRRGPAPVGDAAQALTGFVSLWPAQQPHLPRPLLNRGRSAPPAGTCAGTGAPHRGRVRRKDAPEVSRLAGERPSRTGPGHGDLEALVPRPDPLYSYRCVRGGGRIHPTPGTEVRHEGQRRNAQGHRLGQP
jgi:hypothetical protein